MKKYIYSTFLLFLFLGCEKEVEVVTSFPFEISADFNKEIVLNVETSLSIDITPEQIVKTNEYLFSYRVLSGDAFIQLENGNRLEEEETTTLNSLRLESIITTETIGDVEIEVTVDDQQGIKETIVLHITSENNPFEVEITAIRSDVTVNAESSFSVTLTNTGDDKTISYEAKYFISQGKGEIRKVIDNQFSQVELGESQDLEEGTTNYTVIFTGDGSNVITVEVTDSNGQKITKMFSFNVEVIDFNFTATPARNETNLNIDVPITFLISEIDGGADEYKLRYVIENGNANVFNNTTQLIAGSNISVPLAEEFSLTFGAIEEGSVDLRFFVKNGSGVEKSIAVSIQVRDRSFDFTVNRNLASVPIGEPLVLTYAITEEGGASPDEYTMVFSSSANGTLTVNSVEYNAGEIITVPSLNFQAVYRALTPGDHRITSNITATSNNLTVEKDVSVFIEPSDFEFSVTGPIEVTVGETIDLEFTVNELVGNSDLDARYLITGVDGEFRNENDVLLNIDADYDVDNTFKWTLKGIVQGTMNVTFAIKNQFGVRKTQTLTIKILPIDFNFTVIPSTNVFNLQDPIPFAFTMDAPSSLTYELSFAANTNGIFKNNFDDLLEGGSTPISNTSFTVVYYPELAGNSVVDLTITASNGVIKTRSVNFNIYQDPVITNIFRINNLFFKNCGPHLTDRSYYITWEKDPNVAIISAQIRIRDVFNSQFITKTFTPPISTGSSFDQVIVSQCFGNFDGDYIIEVSIIDSDGRVSETFTKRIIE